MASRTDICETLPSLRCVSCICRQGLLLAGLVAFLPCTCFQGFVAFFGLPCFVFALFFFRFSFLCCGLVHFPSPFLFCDGVLGIRNGHFCFSLFSPLFRFWLCSLRLGTIRVSCPFFLRNSGPDISYDTRLFSSTAVAATFACVAATRSSALLMLFRGILCVQQFLQIWSPLQEPFCASHDSNAGAACFIFHTLYLHHPQALPPQSRHTLLPWRARCHAAAENLLSSLRVLQTLHKCVRSHVLQIR